MKRKHLSLAIAALLAAGGLWFARSAWHTHAFHKSSMGVGVETQHGQSKSGQMPDSPARLAPPDPIRKFWELTPEQRVERARHPVGG